jgi:hypothetical protein
MESEAKPGRTIETPLTVLQVLTEKFRPVLERAWRRSHAAANRDAKAQKLAKREEEIFLAGFQRGWVAGALDVTSVRPTDLPDQDPSRPPGGSSSDVH